jgi:hypothetical protein
MDETNAFNLTLEQLRGFESRVKFEWPDAADLDLDTAAIRHLDRCLAQFEDFCVVTESARHGIPAGVRLVDHAGRPLYAGGSTGA